MNCFPHWAQLEHTRSQNPHHSDASPFTRPHLLIMAFPMGQAFKYVSLGATPILTTKVSLKKMIPIHVLKIPPNWLREYGEVKLVLTWDSYLVDSVCSLGTGYTFSQRAKELKKLLFQKQLCVNFNNGN